MVKDAAREKVWCHKGGKIMWWCKTEGRKYDATLKNMFHMPRYLNSSPYFWDVGKLKESMSQRFIGALAKDPRCILYSIHTQFHSD